MSFRTAWLVYQNKSNQRNIFDTASRYAKILALPHITALLSTDFLGHN